MATKIDVSALTLNPEEATELSELIFEQEFVQGVLSEDHEIETDVLWDKQIVFVGKFGDDLVLHAGCTPVEGGVLPTTEKFWVPRKFGSRHTHCADDLNILFKALGKARRMNPDFYDNINDPAGQLLAARIGVMLRENLPVKVWFSDTNADVIAGGGVFTAGTNLDRFNVIDGLWIQIRAEIGVGDSNYIEITQNTGNKATQFLTPVQAYNLLQNMSDARDERLAELDANVSNSMFLVTRSISDPYRRYLQDNNVTNGFLEVVENGRPKLFFDGIEVRTKFVWDRIIRTDQNDTVGDTFFQPMRALLTLKENIPVGTLSESDFDEVDAFYDRTLKTSILDTVFNLDAKFLENYLAVAAY